MTIKTLNPVLICVFVNMPFAAARMRDVNASGTNYGTNHFGDRLLSPNNNVDSHNAADIVNAFNQYLSSSRQGVNPKINGLLAEHVNFTTNIHVHTAKGLSRASSVSQIDLHADLRKKAVWDSPQSSTLGDLPNSSTFEDTSDGNSEASDGEDADEDVHFEPYQPDDDDDEASNPDNDSVTSAYNERDDGSESDAETPGDIVTDATTSTSVMSEDTDDVVTVATTNITVIMTAKSNAKNTTAVAAVTITMVIVSGTTVITITVTTTTTATIEAKSNRTVMVLMSAMSGTLTITDGATTKTNVSEIDSQALKVSIKDGATANIDSINATLAVNGGSHIVITTNPPLSKSMDLPL